MNVNEISGSVTVVLSLQGVRPTQKANTTQLQTGVEDRRETIIKREGDEPLSPSHKSVCRQNYDNLLLNLFLKRPKDRLDHRIHSLPTSRTTLANLETRRQFLGPRSQTALPRLALLFEMEHHAIAHSSPN